MATSLSRFRIVQGGAGLSAALSLIIVGTAPVAAQEASVEVGFDAINEVVPEVLNDGTMIDVELDTEVSSGEVEVVVPADAEVGISIEQTGGQELTIGLPFAEEAQSVETDEGIVFDNGNGSSTVPLVKEDGVVQVITTIADTTAPTEYEYELDMGAGGVVVLTEVGGAEVVTDDGLVVATIDAPWAYDADGASVHTHYEVRGDTLVQVIEHGKAGVAYPVVADPRVSLGWKIYVRYSKSEVKQMTTGWRGTVNDKTKYASALCAALIGGGAIGAVAAAACALYVYDSADSIMRTAKAAAARNQCLEIQYLYNGMPVVWKRYAC